MATNNFHNENASKIFSCLGSYETPVLDDDGNETDEMEFHIPEQWEYEDFVDNIVEDLISNFGFENGQGRDLTELRSFPSSILAHKTVTKFYGDAPVNVTIVAIIRSGYYDGCNLDWSVAMDTGNDYDEWLGDVDQVAEDLNYYGGLNEGLAKIFAPKAIEWAENAQNELVEELEKVFASYTQPLNKVAQFSNGEAVYEKADTLKAELA